MTLSADERAAIESRHKPKWPRYTDDGHGPQPSAPCVECRQPWWGNGDWYGCDPIRLLAALVAAEEGRERALAESTYYLTRAVDAEARAKALAEAVRNWDEKHHVLVDAMNRGQYHYSERESLFKAADEASAAFRRAEDSLRAALAAYREANDA